MASVLPKKRAMQGSGGRLSVKYDLNRRVVSGRTVSGARSVSGSRHVSRGDMFVAAEDDSFAEDAIDFHENKNTIMSNFEEWIKLSTDNKITSKNSWQFALIDYFYDLNVIKDGDNINFQRASATLDGCVKIYSSRVESVALETGKLLSGLAKKKSDEALDEEEEEEDNGEHVDPASLRKERRVNRVVESTLLLEEALRIKKLDQELAIDPLFKKALSDFDEGGIKSLLLNTLRIDASMRVVFDATTNAPQETTEDSEEYEAPLEDLELRLDEVDVEKLKALVLKDDDELETATVVPTMPELEAVFNDIGNAKSVLGDVNSRLGKEDEGAVQDNEEPEQPAYDDFGLDDRDMPDMPEMPEDGHFMDFANMDAELAQAPVSDDEEVPVESEVVTGHVLDQELMSYFDKTMKDSWRGPEHWRVAAFKKHKNFDTPNSNKSRATTPQPDTAQPKRKRKEQITIDFFKDEDEDYIEDIFQPAKKAAPILRSPDSIDTTNYYLLPDDIQFNSKKLVTLFIKPDRSIVTFSRRAKLLRNDTDVLEKAAYTDQAYFAGEYQKQEQEREEEERQEKLAASFHQAELEDYDNYGDIDFNDVLGGADLANAELKPESQFVTEGRRARPEYVNFSRVAKRVDIKLLKDNLWKAIKPEAVEAPVADNETPEKEQTPVKIETDFTEVAQKIGKMYKPEEKKDLSTSFCFICILHLANEHKLDLSSNDNHDDLRITGF
ncbi:hypothetical protein C7M61_003182 [Candidozyma pseudohaemuli]|uniref:Condensin complex subunit 2 n=1 Tax=Candidozyma pseudohaemuli TaxID=418784 RepID=A0A2P7YPP0_9ASCO|nr:hypothetical protein C7M61_003182 [[Candida] pseudohaemulonii]PSK37931.1 hypothetical protein C7M61_003182 [[Candida] pseudohaemulonii]